MKSCVFCGKPATPTSRICDSTECAKRQYDSWMEESIVVPDGFVTATEFAKVKGISVQAVAKNCRNGKYEGAFQDPQSGRWYIPIVSNVRFYAGAMVIRRKERHRLKATEEEWNKIVENAAKNKLSVNDFLLKRGLEK